MAGDGRAGSRRRYHLRSRPAFARPVGAGQLPDGRAVLRDSPASILRDLEASALPGDARLVVTFPVVVPDNFDEREVLQLLEQQGYTRVHARDGRTLEIVQDRFRLGSADRSRMLEAFEAALRVGRGRVAVRAEGDSPEGQSPIRPRKLGQSPDLTVSVASSSLVARLVRSGRRT